MVRGRAEKSSLAGLFAIGLLGAISVSCSPYVDQDIPRVADLEGRPPEPVNVSPFDSNAANRRASDETSLKQSLLPPEPAYDESQQG
jgi:hypothetical protein